MKGSLLMGQVEAISVVDVVQLRMSSICLAVTAGNAAQREGSAILHGCVKQKDLNHGALVAKTLAVGATRLKRTLKSDIVIAVIGRWIGNGESALDAV